MSENLADYLTPNRLKELGRTVHWQRAEEDISLQELAEKTQCSIDELDNLESGFGQFDVRNLPKVAENIDAVLIIKLKGNRFDDDF